MHHNLPLSKGDLALELDTKVYKSLVVTLLNKASSVCCVLVMKHSRTGLTVPKPTYTNSALALPVAE
jgi:hypothetical protein